MRAWLGFLVLLLSGPVFGAALRGGNKPTLKRDLSPAFQQLKQTPDTGAAPVATDPAAATTTAGDTPAPTTPSTPAADTPTTPSTPAADTPTTPSTPAADTGSAAETSADTASNSDLEAEQAKLNSIKDQIAEEQVKLDAVHAATLVTNPEMSGTKQFTDDMSNDQVDDLTKQVLTMPNLQAEDDKAKAASCAAPGGAAGASGGASGAAAPAAGGDAPAAGGDAAAATAGGDAAAGGASDAEIMKKHQEFATLIKHAQQSLDDINVMPYLGQNSDKEASALTCGAPAAEEPKPATEGDAAAAASGAGTAAAAGGAAPAAAAAAPKAL